MLVKNFFRALIRRQRIDRSDEGASQLNRCLSTLDLTLLGIGSTLGLGIYVIAGQVASTKAGPAVVVSFFIAAVASVFAGLCYAEFGARVPRAGSAYVYSYVTVGEFMAFVIGWNLILEYTIGTASVARGYSGYLDSLVNKTIQTKLTEMFPFHLPTISPYPDFLALGITLLLTIMLSIGVRESTRFNNLFTALNLIIVLYAVICGAFKSDIKNWQLQPSEIPKDKGVGGFLPFGVSGMMAGAATCFYAFIGFDCIATTGEEVKNPQKSIPISIVLSLLAVFCAYFSIAAVETLMWPYYDQNDPAPLPYVFGRVGWPVARMVISIGALAGLSTSLLGSMFPLPRILYAMATDGLIFRILANVHPRFKTPLLATGISGLLAGGMAMMFNVEELADMMSIGTLLAYSLVAVSVLMLRYRKEEESSVLVRSGTADYGMGSNVEKSGGSPVRNGLYSEGSPPSSTSVLLNKLVSSDSISYSNIMLQIFNIRCITEPTALSTKVSTFIIAFISILFFVMDSLLVFKYAHIVSLDRTILITVGALLCVIILFGYALSRQPTSQVKLSFKVPFVPLIPLFSMAINIYLMLQLSVLTWVRFAVWMSIGFIIYFGYGLWHSSLRHQNAEKIHHELNGSRKTSDDIQLQMQTNGSAVTNHHDNHFASTPICTADEELKTGQSPASEAEKCAAESENKENEAEADPATGTTTEDSAPSDVTVSITQDDTAESPAAADDTVAITSGDSGDKPANTS